MYEVFINHHSLIISNSTARENYKHYDFNAAFVWASFLNNLSEIQDIEPSIIMGVFMLVQKTLKQEH